MKAENLHKLLLLLATLLYSAAATAQPQATATARKLANEGIDAYEAGDCKTTLERLERAEALHHAAVHLRYMARCYKQAGRWVAATEIWRRLIREVPADAPEPVRAAADEARRELPAGEAQLATATIRVPKGVAQPDVVLDGKPLPAALLGVEQVVDPGDHRLTVSAPGYQPLARSFHVDPQGHADVVLALTPSAGEASQVERTSPSGGSPLATAGALTLIGGGAVLVAGTVTWLMRNNKRSTLEDDCPNNECRFASESDFEERRQTIVDLTTATNVLVVTGAVLSAAGVTLLVVAGGAESRPTARLRAVATPRAGGLFVHGSF